MSYFDEVGAADRSKQILHTSRICTNFRHFQRDGINFRKQIYSTFIRLVGCGRSSNDWRIRDGDSGSNRRMKMKGINFDFDIDRIAPKISRSSFADGIVVDWVGVETVLAYYQIYKSGFDWARRYRPAPKIRSDIGGGCDSKRLGV